MIASPLVLAIMLANAALLVWRKVPLAGIQVSIAVGSVAAALFLPLGFVNTVCVLASVGGLAIIFHHRHTDRLRVWNDEREISLLMHAVGEQACAYCQNELSEEQFLNIVAFYRERLDRLNCDLLVTLGTCPDDDVRVFVSRRH